MKFSLDCIYCMIKKNEELYSQYESDEAKKIEFLKTVMSIISKSGSDESAPYISTKITRALSEVTNISDHYIEEKVFSNNLILQMENEIMQNINASDDKLIKAIQYSLAGNYIDFGAMNVICEDTLKDIINKVHDFVIDDKTISKFKSDLQNSKKLAYLTDNAGEIVFDKMLIKIIKDLYPNIKIDAIVRGYPVLNDATMQDAIDIGLDSIVDITGNGFDAPGTVLNHINKESKDIIDSADIIISKGMGNFETLYTCDKNVYYAFLCKCDFFTKRFGMKKFEGIFKHESDIGL